MIFFKIDLYEEPNVKEQNAEPVVNRVLTIMSAASGFEQPDDQLDGSERQQLVARAIMAIAKPPASHFIELGNRITERFASHGVGSIVENV